MPTGYDLTKKMAVLTDPDDDTRKVELDSSFKALYTMDVAHHEIHEGNTYMASGISGTLGVDDTFILTAITPNTAKWSHVFYQASGILKFYIRIYEGATVDVAGSAVTAINKNRNSTNTSGGTFREDDTFTDLGDQIYATLVATGTRNGGSEGTRLEWVLKQNTTYAFHLTSADANNILSGQLEWYEHQDE